MPPVISERSRTEARLQSYARTVRHAFLLAALSHLILAVAIHPSIFLLLLHPRTLIGYPGESRPGALDAAGAGGRGRPAVFRLPRPTGPANLVSLQFAGSLPPQRQEPSAKATAGEIVPVPGAPDGAARAPSAGRGGGIRLELDENGSVVAGSGSVAYSEKFQTLRIVRPEYPRSAIHAGIQGLVRLQVQVDTAGKVVEVETQENTTSSTDLESAAIEAMLLWEFKPYVEHARPVPFTLIVPFRYRLVD
jgi:TonB family protein